MADRAAPGVMVLVAEDETLVRMVTVEALEDAGFQVYEARDGQEALTILEVRGHAIRALVSDITMPNLNGLDLARIVDARWPHVGIVVVSAYPPQGIHAAIPSGARFIPKPCREKQIVGAVTAVLSDKAAVAAPVALHSFPTIQPGRIHGSGGLAQPLREPEE